MRKQFDELFSKERLKYYEQIFSLWVDFGVCSWRAIFSFVAQCASKNCADYWFAI